MAQNDQLDREALDYLHDKNIAFSKQIPSDRLKGIAEGGKRGNIKTHVTDKARQARSCTYVSDEPDRFVKYIEDLKGQFATEEEGLNMIKQKFKDDPSLAHLLEGFMDYGGIGKVDAELKTILKTETVKAWYGWHLVAQRLKIDPKIFQSKILPSASPQKITYFNNMLSTKKQKVRLSFGDIYDKQREGTVKGQKTTGTLRIVKIFSKPVAQYRDAKGRIISVKKE